MRPALRTDEIKIDQLDPIIDEDDRDSEIVQADEKILADKEHLDRLMFEQEPVTIEIYPASERNAPTSYFCEVNGHKPEVIHNGIWQTLPVSYVPVGLQMTMKRCYVDVLVRAKSVTITTQHDELGTQNVIHRVPSAVANVQILVDNNPRGPAHFADLRRRTY